LRPRYVLPAIPQFRFLHIYRLSPELVVSVLGRAIGASVCASGATNGSISERNLL